MIREINSETAKKMVISAAANLSNHRQEVDNMNVFPVPDGDTGTNMSMTMDACERAVCECGEENLSKLVKIIADAALRGARGNSGVILSQLLRGIQKTIDTSAIDCKGVSRAIQNAAKSAYKAVMKPTEGTILTVAREMSECAKKYENDFEDITDFLSVVYKSGYDALQKTPEMLPQLKQAGVVDSGGQGLVYIFEGVLTFLKGEMVIERNQKQELPVKSAAANTEVKNLKYKYCTECIVEKKNSKVDAFSLKMALEPKGDSMVLVDDDEVIKIHIHTNRPDFVLSESLKYGQLFSVKIENMKIQHSNMIDSKKSTNNSDKNAETEIKKYGFVCVSAGDGLEKTFKELGVDCIIRGGQTMNPSTDDILNAIEAINAQNVFVFPNNKNIIMASEQAKELSSKNVFVVPTKSITQAMTSILSFDEDKSPEDNFKEMSSVLDDIKSAQITYAVRDTVVDDKEIKPGDVLGILDGKIVSVEDEINNTVIDVLCKSVDDETSVITLFYGEEVAEQQALSLKEELEEKFDECDIYMHFGGQPVYFYLISIE